MPRVVPFDPALAPAFSTLNREWIERLFAIEPADLNTLSDPEGAIIVPGGQIFFALDGPTAIGTVAAVLAGPGASSWPKWRYRLRIKGGVLARHWGGP